MPRTIDHIVACHEAAFSLRKAGKPVWKQEINIKSILHEDPMNVSAEHVASVASRIVAKLRASLPASALDVNHEDCDWEIHDLIEEMGLCTADRFGDDNPADGFNDWLSMVYDWADTNRIWLGL